MTLLDFLIAVSCVTIAVCIYVIVITVDELRR